jgi:hypothetical protein
VLDGERVDDLARGVGIVAVLRVGLEEVWRNGRIFVGLRVDLAGVTEERVQELIEHAWRNRAPKRLVAEHDRRHDAREIRPRGS